MKSIINSIVLSVLCIINLFIILKNFSKIKDKDIIIQDKGGFGNTFEICDLSRYLFKSNFFFILFYDDKRHNKYLPIIFQTRFIALKSNLNIKFLEKNYSIGIKENEKNYILEFLIYLIKIISKKNIYRNHDLFKFSKKKGFKNFDLKQKKSSQWKGFYYKLVKTNNKKLYFEELEKKLNHNELIFYKKLKKQKNICIYLRNKGVFMHPDNYLRNGSNKSEYIKMIKYILTKRYNVLLTGDKVFDQESIDQINKNSKYKVFDTNLYYDLNVSLFRLLFVGIARYYIAEPGGANYFGLYKKSLHINTFPFCESLTCEKYLFKKVWVQKKNFFLNKFEFKKKFYHNFNLGKYKLLSNSSEDLYKFIKKNVS